MDRWTDLMLYWLERPSLPMLMILAVAGGVVWGYGRIADRRAVQRLIKSVEAPAERAPSTATATLRRVA